MNHRTSLFFAALSLLLTPAFCPADESSKPGLAAPAGELLEPSPDVAKVRDVTADAALHEKVSSYFTSLRKALANENSEAVSQHLWGKGIVLAVINRGLFKAPFGDDAEDFKRGFIDGFAGALDKKVALMAASLGYDDFRLRRIEEIREGEVIVYVRHWDEEFQLHTNMRWWLIRDPELGWRAYDYEDIDQNVRLSSIIGVMLGAIGGDNDWIEPVAKLIRTMEEFQMSGEIDGVPPEIDAVLKSSAPDALKSIAHFFRYSCLTMEGDFEPALAAIEEMEKIDADAPIIAFGKGICFSGLGRYEEAIAEANVYAKKLGWDSNTCDLVAYAYFLKGDNASAIKFAMKGLADTPSSIDCLIDLALALPADRIGEFHDFAAAMEDAEEAYDWTLDFLIYEEYPKQAKLVFKLLKAKLPDSDLIEYYAPDIAILK